MKAKWRPVAWQYVRSDQADKPGEWHLIYRLDRPEALEHEVMPIGPYEDWVSEKIKEESIHDCGRGVQRAQRIRIQ